ncbi:MAG: histidine kinase [Chloroflexia bacterium]|nr:histidine kinase [Chloroflexia bacterium]
MVSQAGREMLMSASSSISLSRRMVGHVGGRTATLVAWSLCALTLVLVAGALAIARLNRTEPEVWLIALGVVSSGIVGGVVASRRPANPVGWLFASGAVGFALRAFGSEYATYGLVTRAGSLPGALALAWLQAILVIPVIVSILALVPLFFPDGQLVSPRWRPVVWLTIGWSVVETVRSAVRPGDLQDVPGVDNPVGITSLRPIIEFIDGPTLAIWLAILFAVSASLVVRLRRSAAEERQQVKWLAYAVVGWVLMVLLTYPAAAIDPTAERAASIGVAFAFAGIPLAAGIAVLRYRLYDIDLIINRTLVYGLLTVGVAGVYVLVVGYLAAIIHARDQLAVSLLSTGLVALLFQPMRERLQRAVNRLMYGERDQPYRVLSRLGQRLEATLAPEEILAAIVQTVASALKLPYAAIALRHEDAVVVAAATGQPVANALRLPLVYQGEPVGELRLAPRAGDGALSAADRRLLEDLARQAGVAVHAVRLAADLQRSRERLVTAREEERRRLRQDLHDGLGPGLASVSLQLAAARNLVGDKPDAVVMLTEIKAQLQDAVADIRRLVYALRPPTLDELGLVGAISEHAARLGHGGLRISIEAPESLPPLPAAVEVAAYRIALEGLTNISRHARARSCVMRLSVVEPGADDRPGGDGHRTLSSRRVVCLELVDDGRGMDPSARPGAGLVSMRERARELGGAFVIEPASGGGTRLYARLPIPADGS